MEEPRTHVGRGTIREITYCDSVEYPGHCQASQERFSGSAWIGSSPFCLFNKLLLPSNFKLLHTAECKTPSKPIRISAAAGGHTTTTGCQPLHTSGWTSRTSIIHFFYLSLSEHAVFVSMVSFRTCRVGMRVRAARRRLLYWCCRELWRSSKIDRRTRSVLLKAPCIRHGTLNSVAWLLVSANSAS